MKYDFDEVENYLQLVGSDPATLEAFRLRYPALFRWFRENDPVALAPEPHVRRIEPLPAFDRITAIQTALFDNWPNGQRSRGNPNRYGMALEVWTDPNPEVTKSRSCQYKMSMKLMTAKEITKRAQSLTSTGLKHPISQAYAEYLIDLASAAEPSQLFGMIATKTPADGTIYHDFQFVMMDIKTSRCVLVIGSEPRLLNSFSKSHACGDDLGAKVVGQSRVDWTGNNPDWQTESLDDSDL